MKTPKEKAAELIDKMLSKNPNRQDGVSKIDIIQANLCALVAVDEIIYYLEIVLGVDKCDFEYWQEVKQEILKM